MHRLLEEVPLFDGVNPCILRQISQKISLKKYKLNRVVVTEASSNEYFYIIKSGEVRVFRENKDGEKIILAILGEGEFFGEMSILESNLASASVITTQDSEFICIRDRQFMSMVKRTPSISTRMFSNLSKRIRYCDDSIKNLNKHCTCDRVATVLLYFAEKRGYRRSNSVVIKKMPFQYSIASLAGISRESVSRAFNNLQDNDYIIKTGRELVINDYQRFYEDFNK
ncbi:MAG: Crp/Fnr family transcriptional regulator [Candidatus Neomarinimicrobiota bacterium]